VGCSRRNRADLRSGGGRAGLGESLSYNYGDAELEDDDDYWADLDTETDAVGLGFVFDSNLAQDRLFNYRVNASLEYFEQKVSQGGFEDRVEGTRVAIDQTFGFGFIRTPAIRVFAGPSLHLGVGRIDDEIDDGFSDFDYEVTSRQGSDRSWASISMWAAISPFRRSPTFVMASRQRSSTARTTSWGVTACSSGTRCAAGS